MDGDGDDGGGKRAILDTGRLPFVLFRGLLNRDDVGVFIMFGVLRLLLIGLPFLLPSLFIFQAFDDALSAHNNALVTGVALRLVVGDVGALFLFLIVAGGADDRLGVPTIGIVFFSSSLVLRFLLDLDRLF
jgi:hypothetical protein